MTENLPDGSAPPNQLSVSWTFYSLDESIKSSTKKMARDGQTLLVITGDNHALCPDNNRGTSRALAHATVVGGTILEMSEDGTRWKSESAATDGGGVIKDLPVPSYQKGVAAGVPGASPDWRLTPDISMVSCDGSHGKCGIFVSYKNGGTASGVGGTSAASPLWAGYIALANELRSQKGFGPLGFLNPLLYAIYANPPQYAQDFHDITSGTTPANPCSTGVPYSAAPGYDLVTGLGSPKAQLVADLVLPPAPRCQAIPVGCDGSITITCTGLDVGIDVSPCSGPGGDPTGCSLGYNGSTTVSFSVYPASPEGKACTEENGAKNCVELNFPYGRPLGACQACGEGEKWCDKFTPPRCAPVHDCTVIATHPN